MHTVTSVGVVAVLAGASLSAGTIAPVAAAPVSATACAGSDWVPGWNASPGGAQKFAQEDTNGPFHLPVAGYPVTLPRIVGAQTMRMITTPLTDGQQVRLRFSNRFGRDSVTFSRVSVAAQTRGPGIDPASSTPVTFDGGKQTVVVPAGEEITTDPASFAVRPFDKVAVTFFIPDIVKTPPTYHWDANHTSYLSPAFSGDHTFDVAGRGLTNKTSSVYYLSGLEVRAATPKRTVAVLGDSFTESIATTPDADRRWPDYLTRRLQATAAGREIAVASAAISFNFAAPGIPPFLLGPPIAGLGGYAGTERIGTDVLPMPGLDKIILLLGNNDVAFGRSAGEVIDAYRAIVATAHAAGVEIYAATLSPLAYAKGLAFIYGLPSPLAEREKINTFIRTSGLFDGVFDFAAAVGRPGNPNVWDVGMSPDNVHPSDAAAEREAQAVDLETILACRR